ncbi:MAG: hypothetical protein SOV68_03635 [Ligilactobacillus salivarius]|nr:hypothetical protein [Ligilactobacillus salivarius]
MKKVFNKICKKIDELVISKKRKAIRNSNLSSLYTISVIVFLKGKKIKFERVSVFNESGKWLEIHYFDEDKNKKCKAKFRIDNPNFIGYIPKIEMKYEF